MALLRGTMAWLVGVQDELGYGWVRYRGGYTGWVIRVLYRDPPTSCSGSSPETAERARKPCRGWSGGLRAAGEPAAVRTLVPPFGPGRSLQALPVPGS